MTDKRFTETVSTGIVTDNMTGKEFNCDMRIDDELLELLNKLSDENEQLKQELQNLRAEKTYETITLRERVPNETIERFKQDLQNGEFIELTARPNVRKHKNDHIEWKGDME